MNLNVRMFALLGALWGVTQLGLSQTLHGQFGAVLSAATNNWPNNLFTIEAVQMPDGKLVFWGYKFNAAQAQIWDPATGLFSTSSPQAIVSDWDLFCSGATLLSDGRMMTAGGHIMDNFGQPEIGIMDNRTWQWSNPANMRFGRWYPTTLLTHTGDIFIVGGSIDYYNNSNNERVYEWDDVPEIWNPTTNTITQWPNSDFQTYYYPYLFMCPNNRVFYAGGKLRINGAHERDTLYFNLDSMTTTFVSTSKWRGGAAVMYEPGKILKCGTGQHTVDVPAVSTSEQIDLESPSPDWSPTGALNVPRREHNLVVLPDGRVMVFGGSDTFNQNVPVNLQQHPEIWNPATGQWSLCTEQADKVRNYHSVAFLYSDGRVFTGGGNYSPTAQWYSPDYLFKGDRPKILTCPQTIKFGSKFIVDADQKVSKVVLIGLAAVTHSFNFSQIRVPLNFAAFGTVKSFMKVSAPPYNWYAPSAWYMLFVLNEQGVPSIAKYVHLEQ